MEYHIAEDIKNDIKKSPTIIFKLKNLYNMSLEQFLMRDDNDNEPRDQRDTNAAKFAFTQQIGGGGHLPNSSSDD